MADKTIAEKLLIKPGSSFWISERSRRPLIEPIPEGVMEAKSAAESTNALLFAEDSGSLRTALDSQGDSLRLIQSLWIAYPKANRSDINRDTLWPVLAERGMRPIGQVAIDETWSALRFRPLKPGEAQFTGGQS